LRDGKTIRKKPSEETLELKSQEHLNAENEQARLVERQLNPSIRRSFDIARPHFPRQPPKLQKRSCAVIHRTLVKSLKINNIRAAAPFLGGFVFWGTLRVKSVSPGLDADRSARLCASTNFFADADLSAGRRASVCQAMSLSSGISDCRGASPLIGFGDLRGVCVVRD